MSLLNNNFLTVDGDAIGGRVPTKLVVESVTGAQLSKGQMLALKKAYKIFCDNTRLSPAKYHVQNIEFPDGMKARLVSNNGVDTVTANVEQGGGVTPCVNIRVEQGDDSDNIKGVLKYAPNTLSGKQIGDTLYTKGGGKLKRFSLPAAEGDTYLFKAPWHKKATILFGRDKHYCPFPGSSVKVGHSSWPCGMELPDGAKKIWIFDVQVSRSQSGEWRGDGSITYISVTERDNPETELCSIALVGVRPLREFVNSTMDGSHAVLTLTQFMVGGLRNSPDYFNDLSGRPCDPENGALIEFEVSASPEGKPKVTAVELWSDSNIDGLPYGMTAYELAIDPGKYMESIKPKQVAVDGNVGMGYPRVILGGYDKNNKRVFIYSTIIFRPDVSEMSFYRNEELVHRTEAIRTDENPPSPDSVNPDYLKPYFSAYYLRTIYWDGSVNGLQTIWHPVFMGPHSAVTNNVVAYGFPEYIGEDTETTFIRVSFDSGTKDMYSPYGVHPVYSARKIKAVVVIPLEGKVVILDTPVWLAIDYEKYSDEYPIVTYSGSNFSSSLPGVKNVDFPPINQFENKREQAKIYLKDMSKANDVRAGVSLNPATGEVAFGATVVKPPVVGGPDTYGLFLEGVGFVGPAELKE